MNIKFFIPIFLILISATVFAEDYIDAVDASDRGAYDGPIVQGNWETRGTRAAFDTTFENVQWATAQCSPHGPVITGIELDIVYSWKPWTGDFDGKQVTIPQYPIPLLSNGSDFAYVYFDGPYAIDTQTTSSGTLAGGLKGIKFDNIPENQEKIVKHLSLKIQPQEPYTCCEQVPLLNLVTEYYHTYDGPMVISVDDGISIGPGIPASVSAGITVHFSNNYVWKETTQTRLINPGGKTCDNILLGNTDKCVCTESQTGYRTTSPDSSNSSLCADLFGSNLTTDVCSTAQSRDTCTVQIQSCMPGYPQYSDLNPSDICSALNEECSMRSSSDTRGTSTSTGSTANTSGPLEWLIKTIKQIINF